jgi:hypothetical protein
MGKTEQKVDSSPNQKPEILAGKRKTAQLNPKGEGPITGDPLEDDLSGMGKFNPTFEDENYIKSVLADPELHNAGDHPAAAAAHDIAAEKVALTVKDRIRKTEFDFAKDMMDETKALTRLAKHKGYESVDDFAINHPAEFKAATEKWRAERPMPKDVAKPSEEKATPADEKLHSVPKGQRGSIGEAVNPSLEDIAGLYGTGIEKRHGERATVSQLEKFKDQSGKIDTKLVGRIGGALGGALGGFTPFSLRRQGPNYEEGIALGIKLSDRPVESNKANGSVSSQTNTPEFKKWFGDSKVVDADGMPLVVYHGTTRDVVRFDQSAPKSTMNADAEGLYFTAFHDDASNYAAYPRSGDAAGANVMPVYVSLKNPKIVDSDSFETAFVSKSKRQELERQGYDGMMTADKAEIVAFRSEQVKSAIGNNGMFDTSNPNILFSRTEEATTRPHSIETARAALVESMSGSERTSLQSMLSAGKARIITSDQAAKIEGRELHAGDQAFFHTASGTTYFVADHIDRSISADELKGLVRHEIAVHAFQLGRTNAEFKDILHRLDLMNRMKNAQVREAFMSVPKDTAAENVPEEALAYLVQHAPDLKLVQRIVAWFRQALRSIGWVNTLSTNDILHLAQSANDPVFIHKVSSSKSLEGALADVADAEYHGERATVSQLEKFKDQSGKIDTKLVGRIGGALGGAAIGYAIDKDDPIEGAIGGALGGFALAGMTRRLYDEFSVRSLKDAFDIVKPTVDLMRAKAAEAGFANQGAIAATLRNVDAVTNSAKKAISAKRLEEIGVLVSAGKLDKLTPDELVYVKHMSQELARLGTHAQEAGVIPHLLPPSKYGVPLIWDFKNTTTKELFDKFMGSGAGETPNASGFTPFSLRRQGPNYEEGIALGMKPKTTNMADLLSIYARSVVKATENAKTLSSLKSLKVSPDNYAVEPIGNGMPKEYVINHGIGGLEGFGVHPEMVEPLKIAFDSYSPGMRARAMLTVAFGAKRILMSYSGFHASSLTTAYAAAMGNPALMADVAVGAVARGAEKLGEKVAGAVTGKKHDFQYKVPYRSGIDKAIQAYHAGGDGDIYDFLARNGLKAEPGMEDINGRDQWKKFMDSAIPGASKIDNAAHSFTFGYIYVGIKLDLARAKFESELLNPKNAGKDVNQIARDVSTFVNDVGGGLNIPRIVEGMRSKLGRALAQDTLSKRGLGTAQLGLLAPDWFYSTLRAWTQAIPGLSENARVGRLHRGYIVNGVLMTLAISDGINYNMSGHHLWENDFRSEKEKKKKENPSLQERILFMTRTDLGDGRYMSLNKHLFEFIHMLTAPAEFASGKLSPIVSDPMSVLQNKQWNNLSSKWAPPITEGGTIGEVLGDEAKYLAGKHAPIGFQQGIKGNFSGIGGFPISGMKPEDLAALREKSKEEKHKRREEAEE